MLVLFCLYSMISPNNQFREENVGGLKKETQV